MRRSGGLSGSVLATTEPPRSDADPSALMTRLTEVGIVVGQRTPVDAALDTARQAADVNAQGPLFVSKLSSDS